MRLAFPILFAALLLTGCGQTGSLYLPDEPAATVEPEPTASPPASASETPASEDEAARDKKK